MRRILDASIKTILADDGGEPTGFPVYGGRNIAGFERGMVPSDIKWTTDRGNWMWDGVLVTLRAMGIDPGEPL